MGNFRESKLAASSVVGVILMVGLTVVMAGTVAMSAFVYPLPSDAPDANIVIREARGNQNNFSGNEIVLAHKGGDTLESDGVRIVIDGYGIAYPKNMNVSEAAILGLDDERDFTITYSDLTGYNFVNSNGRRKDRWKYNLTSNDNTHIDEAKIVLNDTWNPGEVVVLYGADGVHSENTNNVDNKYKLTPGSRVTVTIIDIASNKLIASSFATVKESGQVVGY